MISIQTVDHLHLVPALSQLIRQPLDKDTISSEVIRGMPELIEESGGGYVYHSEEELIVAMDKLLKDPSYRNEIGRQGYEAYLRNWTAEIHLKRYFSLINEIATASGKPLD